MKKISTVLVAVIALVLLGSCGSSETQKMNLGTMDGTRYINEYFGLEIEINEDWELMSEEEKIAITIRGTKFAGGDDEKFKEKLEAGEFEQVYLLAAYKDVEDSFEPKITCLAEDLSGYYDIDGEREYLKIMKDGFESIDIGYNFSEEIYMEKAGNTEFYVLESTIEREDFDVTQKFYVKIIKNNAITFITSYSTKEQEEELDEMMQTIELR
ncbi:hypothetical protein RBH29_01550 [Herbivorax sp. ANBcel31]|uniref:hypothetical protein n=1 Tax=Herbivorax sp. ANBcel31 TaxID=3069754 RepID=UPI0027B7A375|nr:hypothetical protein [Herbivorax sp. ANBcel31]MDQ2085121.1 hypothetical protein [Herbivorax sp. ANBcel31]